MSWRDYIPSEREEGPYTGPFSTYTEIAHAPILGLIVGIASVAFGVQWIVPATLAVAFGVRGVAKTDRTKALNEIRKEPWYFAGGLLAGWFLLGPML